MTTAIPRVTWLLDVDGVINAVSNRIPRDVWDESDWIEIPAVEATGGPYRILAALPVLQFISEVARSGRVDIVWHTSWQREVDTLADRLGLPTGLPVLDCPEYTEWDRSKARGWWKVPAVKRWAQANPGTPLLWTDDEIDYRLRPADVDMLADRPLLLLCPPDRCGLTPRGLKAIHRFIDQFRPHPTITMAQTPAEAA